MEIIVTFPGEKLVDAQIGKHLVHTDQPVKEGGQGSAPAPFAYFLVSLATCAGYYALSYLQARDLPTQGLRLVQSHEFGQKGKLTKVGIKIELPAGIPEKHHKPIARSAELCAVKKVIEDPPEFDIQTQVAD